MKDTVPFDVTSLVSRLSLSRPPVRQQRQYISSHLLLFLFIFFTGNVWKYLISSLSERFIRVDEFALVFPNEEEEEEEEKEKVCYHNEASFLAAGGQAGTGQCCDDG